MPTLAPVQPRETIPTAPARPIQSRRDESAPLSSGPKGAAELPARFEPIVSGGSSPVRPRSDSSAPPAPPAASAAANPLDDAPDVVWYVRPPAGGQYGPATRDIMRVWIAEGRVSPDSLVWREGWRDWQEAEAVFPQLKTKSPNDAVPEGLSGMIEEQLASPRTITGSHRTSTGGASKGGNLVFIIFAVVVVLLVALVFIFLHMNKRPAKAAFNAIQTAPAAVRCPAYPSPIAS